MKRCAWVNDEEIFKNYHDNEWGIPVYDDQKLFEMLILEGAQAGLSWITILKRRENYREAFDEFNVEQVASYDEDKIQKLLSNEGIIRNKLKVRGTVKNAKAFIAIRKEFGSFSTYIWAFTEGKPIVNHWESSDEVPAETDLSKKISKDMKKRNFTFVGPVIIYSFMQAVGMVNDHTTDCFRHPEIQGDSTSDVD
ncbi:DNA-3-methyladenine glycosylase I [Pseudalkalibacillus hwajinpoensis]|uniref:DNA-3-methyladenine glycosylase I n=1 Tax=Guptibacillus hwajinpoensis TaxID=208199 RepID=A0A4U1MPD6_9BACL|nr:DNA-3-methyladenine glycosylase I [Pseudalkalibacillus hwajinpoensis]TKD72542.1 DNA-3-methyladenine glycosylase I [Pseudalkalibacillus hwajinpoensis]